MANQSFSEIARHAFPVQYSQIVDEAAKNLLPFVDQNYRTSFIAVTTPGGETTLIPYRINLIDFENRESTSANESAIVEQCLLTRSTDGYTRQSALRQIYETGEPFAIPFCILLAGEYVVEITQTLVVALPSLDREDCVKFVRTNRALIKRLKSKATSYWSCYYRGDYPEKFAYPGLFFLRELEMWAS